MYLDLFVRNMDPDFTYITGGWLEPGRDCGKPRVRDMVEVRTINGWLLKS